MSVSVRYTSDITTYEMPASGHLVAAVKSQLRTAALDQNSTSTPPVSKRAGADKAMTAGAVTIDLTALVGLNGAAVDGTGLRIQYAKFVNRTDNTHAMAIAIGASNGYDGLGAAFKTTLSPGGECLVKLNSAGSVVGGSNKNLDVAGTGVEVLSYEIILG